MTPPPSRGLHGFLAPVAGETPETSIAKTISALSVFAAGIGGLTHGSARAGLAALAGAMEGWQAGDKERADRAYADWKAKTEAALEQWETERQHYHDVLTGKRQSTDEMLERLKLQLAQNGQFAAIAQLEREGAEGAVKWLTDQQDKAIALQKAVEEIERHKTERAEIQSRFEREQAQREKFHADQMRKWEEQLRAAQTPVADETLNFQVDRVLAGGEEPKFGFGIRGAEYKRQFYDRLAKRALEQGLTPAGIQARRIAAKSLSREQGTLQARRGIASAAANNFEKTAEQAIPLSAKVERTQIPLLNQYFLEGRTKLAGDPNVSELYTQYLTLINEYGRAISGSVVVTDTARREAQQILAPSQTQEQFERNIRRMINDLHNQREGFQKQIDEVQQNLLNLGETPAGAPATTVPTAPGPSPFERWRAGQKK